MQIKVGDRVQHTHYSDTAGIVTAVRPCPGEKCGMPSIVLDGYPGLYHAENFAVMQQVWRTVSKEICGGWFVWDVMQVIGDPLWRKGSEKFNKNYIECRDGSLIAIQCDHAFTYTKVGELLKENSFYSVIDIV